MLSSASLTSSCSVPVAGDGLRVVGGDVRRAVVEIAVGRVAALLDHAQHDSVRRANGIARVADEARLGLTPLVEVAVTGRRGKRPDLEVVVLLLDLRQVLLGVTLAG